MSIAQSAVKSILISQGAELVTNALCIQFPFLRIPVIHQLFKMLVQKGMTVLATEGEYALFLAHITNLKDNQGEALKKSSKEYDDAKTAADKAKAKQKVIDDFRKFIKLSNP